MLYDTPFDLTRVRVRVQNPVLKDSPFMKACATGDTSLISQYIKEDPELLNNRTTCSGKTPLLVSLLKNEKNLDLTYVIVGNRIGKLRLH